VTLIAATLVLQHGPAGVNTRTAPRRFVDLIVQGAAVVQVKDATACTGSVYTPSATVHVSPAAIWETQRAIDAHGDAAFAQVFPVSVPVVATNRVAANPVPTAKTPASAPIPRKTDRV